MNVSHMGACCDLSLYFISKWSWLQITLGYKPERVFTFLNEIYFSLHFRIVAAPVSCVYGQKEEDTQGRSIN